MRKIEIYMHSYLAGTLTEDEEGYISFLPVKLKKAYHHMIDDKAAQIRL